MKLKKDCSKQKLRGAYYTPRSLVKNIVRLLTLEKMNINTVLEPSCGDGVFIDSLIELGLLNKIKSVDAIEINKEEANKVSKKYQNSLMINVINQDFFDFYEKELNTKTYDLIVGNPPYIRYQYLTESQRHSQAQILTSHGMKANKLINAWVAFMIACVQMLSEKGKIAFVIPAEILQVDFAEDLRLYLSNHLAKITIISLEQLVFPDIEQKIVIFIGEKSNNKKEIRIIPINDLKELNTLDLNSHQFQPMLSTVKERWTKYFINQNDMELIEKIKKDNRFVKFSEYGTINVGVTTGNNNYFSINEETVNHYQLHDATLPLIGRSSHIHGVYFTEDDWKENRKNGKASHLVSFPDIPYNDYPTEYKDYIKVGEDNNEHLGYKCSSRNRWYVIPYVWIPDAFFLRHNNIYPKFILNCCNAVSTDTMHRIKFNKDIDPKNVLLAYYNSITFAFTEVCGRSYGCGLLEVLPKEVGNILLPKLQYVDHNLRCELLKEIDGIVRSGDDIEKALDLVDREILVNLLGISQDICYQARDIWKKLQKRRLYRS